MKTISDKTGNVFFKLSQLLVVKMGVQEYDKFLKQQTSEEVYEGIMAACYGELPVAYYAQLPFWQAILAEDYSEFLGAVVDKALELAEK